MGIPASSTIRSSGFIRSSSIMEESPSTFLGSSGTGVSGAPLGPWLSLWFGRIGLLLLSSGLVLGSLEEPGP
eukprot:6019414-Heterocapsa_arctica.AAC.1